MGKAIHPQAHKESEPCIFYLSSTTFPDIGNSSSKLQRNSLSALAQHWLHKSHLTVGEREDVDYLKEKDVHLGGFGNGHGLAKQHVGGEDLRPGHELEKVAHLHSTQTQARNTLQSSPSNQDMQQRLLGLDV